ncbi:ATP-dependent DNA ligase [Oxalicibacterium solurbis]|uniref:ATP-dependent DNA ligase n=2 Tax=Oxalicibacterium solurbis TaxID=69280 RepID=A0A8J3ASK8_9BURK|nr:ATP-dependent DNA ligase [Oxalicibacterium solurbis]
MEFRRIATVLLLGGMLTAAQAQTQNRQTEAVRAPVMLANSYHPGVDLAAYWVSEKYDGLRAYWDGERLWTRGGESIHAPAWFVAGWPAVPLDGELWAGRGRFAEAVSTARTQQPDDAAWSNMRFMVFDLPAHGGTFDDRLPVLRQTIAALNKQWVQAVPQEKVKSHAELQQRLHVIVQAGGEGLMLHRGASLYRAERNDDLLKLKLHDDAEAKVLAHLPGKGKHAGRLGALLVQTPDGIRFRLGSGFTDAQREAPPPIGSWVTYRYRGFNDSGIPRFATFLRVRKDVYPMDIDISNSDAEDIHSALR